MESNFEDHGLDSLDAIELIIQIEDELGYVIDAENLEKFKKPKHLVNFISHLEAYKSEFHKLPHEGVHAHFSLGDAFPGLPGTGEKKKKEKKWESFKWNSDTLLCYFYYLNNLSNTSNLIFSHLTPQLFFLIFVYSINVLLLNLYCY